MLNITSIKQIINASRYPATLRVVDDRFTDYTLNFAPLEVKNGLDIWIPWAAQGTDYPGHHILLTAGTRQFAIWQTNDNRRVRLASALWVNPTQPWSSAAGNIFGVSVIEGDRSPTSLGPACWSTASACRSRTYPPGLRSCAMPIRNGGCSASCGRMARRIAANQAAWVRFGSTVSDNILIEQYLLAACIDYHRNRRGSEYHGAGIRYLFRSSREAFTQEAAARAGHTHLIGAAKNNPVLARRLEARVAREYPQHFERCAKLERDGETASSH